MHSKTLLCPRSTVGVAILLFTTTVSSVDADVKWAIALHGGAGSAPDASQPAQIKKRRESLQRALSMGATMLGEGGDSLDAVEAVIRVLERDPLFNAGKGAVYAADGSHELDASIMDGRNLACGAVASARTAKHPITVARMVMEKTDHVLLVGPGADLFASNKGAEIVDNHYFDTRARDRQWRKQRHRPRGAGGSTVGCVALDVLGNLAAGTSTGGLSNKMSGRVGDSPIIGAGTYANNKTCAISCTGHGEHFIRFAVAHDVSARMAYGQASLNEAVELVFSEKLKPGWGGLIAIDRTGQVTMKFNTAAMARATANSEGVFEILWGDGEP